jgi:hypothetical protein
MSEKLTVIDRIENKKNEATRRNLNGFTHAALRCFDRGIRLNNLVIFVRISIPVSSKAPPAYWAASKSPEGN